MEAPPPKGENCKICEFLLTLHFSQLGYHNPDKVRCSCHKNVTYLHCGRDMKIRVCVRASPAFKHVGDGDGEEEGGGEAERGVTAG